MMRELADNIMDIAQNSISAGAKLTQVLVRIDHKANLITLQFTDDGCGMSAEMVSSVTEPFTTTRKTRKVGLGLPLLQQTAMMTGGDLSIESEVGKGTQVTATFGLDHIDRPPLGDVSGAWFSLVVMNPDTDFLFEYDYDGNVFTFDTRMIRETVAPLPLNAPEISDWIRECIYQ
ncbi:MAG: sensor histidine kinase, partial [Clostridiales bacterium]|nr:sensor histidine kinase [Clostridiales bacterium]